MRDESGYPAFDWSSMHSWLHDVRLLIVGDVRARLVQHVHLLERAGASVKYLACTPEDLGRLGAHPSPDFILFDDAECAQAGDALVMALKGAVASGGTTIFRYVSDAGGTARTVPSELPGVVNCPYMQSPSEFLHLVGSTLEKKGRRRTTAAQDVPESQQSEAAPYLHAGGCTDNGSILVAEASGEILLVDGPLDNMLGYPEGTLHGRSIETVIPGWRQWLPKCQDDQKGHMGVVRAEVECATADGGAEFLALTVSAVRLGAAFCWKFQLQCPKIGMNAPWRTGLLLEALGQMSDAVYLMDDDLNILYVNDAACGMLGYSADEMLRLKATDIDASLSIEQMRSLNRQVLQGVRRDVVVETSHRARSGRIIPVSLLLSKLRSGGSAYFLVMARDITERLLVEEERLGHVQLLETLNRVNDVIRQTSDMSDMMNGVLDILLPVLWCDRVYVLSANADGVKAIAVRYRNGFEPPYAVGDQLEIPPDVANHIRSVFSKTGEVVRFGPGGEEIGDTARQEFGFKSNISVLMLPKGADRMYLGAHRAGKSLQWSMVEERLMVEVARRLTDGISVIESYRALKRSEDDYRTLAENLPVGIVKYDAQGCAVYANASMRRLLQRLGSDESTTGRGLVDVANIEAEKSLENMVRNVLTHGRDERLNLTVTIDGAERHFSALLVPERNEQSDRIGVVSICQDMTEIIETERRLRELNAGWVAMLKAIPDLLFELDHEGRYIEVWTRVPELLAMERERLLGRKVSDVLPEDAALQAMGALHEAEAWGASYGKVMRLQLPMGPHYFELSVARKDGMKRDIEKTTYIALSRDVTKRVEAEKKLRNLNVTLRQLTARLEAAREEEREHIARELHDELGQQLTALRFAIGMLDYRFGAENEGIGAATNEILAQVERIIETAKNVSTSLRPPALDMGLMPALEWLVAEFLKYIPEISLQKDASISRLDLEDELVVVVFRVIQESLTNIAKHAKANRVVIALDLKGRVLMVSVRDDGVGFNMTSPRNRDSYGLFSMSERCVAVGGSLRVDSVPGKGTEIFAKFPLKKFIKRGLK